MAEPIAPAANPSALQSEQWYIVKQDSGVCQIIAVTETAETAELSDRETWGPFDSQGEAIARRVGLIRAGKCQPQ